ncbi:DUF1540 domain-containing protein [Kineobactrum sediminis]|uniref:DUF1540 domain-containing protein n=1 Tax=Kineobactrum sediminis TaxID=1905677 RepID=UPI001588AA6E|nr:DUF1540 domain-containing protein [Kineobactrum sediminis]
MANIAVEMPRVKGCQVSECVYNLESACNARAITVGDGATPNCDTFYVASRHARNRNTAGVGACKVTGCRFNDDYECQADEISVGSVESSAMCRTYQSS